jgi:hypothetical protein
VLHKLKLREIKNGAKLLNMQSATYRLIFAGKITWRIFSKKELKTSSNVIGAPHGSQFHPVSAGLCAAFEFSVPQGAAMPPASPILSLILLKRFDRVNLQAIVYLCVLTATVEGSKTLSACWKFALLVMR